MAPKTIITGIEAFPVCVPYKTGRKSDASAWGDRELPAANSLLVKVTTDGGLEGWGEAFGLRAVASAKLALDDLIAPLCIGQNATRIGPIMVEVSEAVARLWTERLPRLWRVGGGHCPLGSCGQAGKRTRVLTSGWRGN